LASAEELVQENQILRERIAQLERSVSGQLDPVLRSLLEHAPAFLTVVTPEGRLLATGRQSEAFGTVVGRSVFEFTEPSQHQVLKDAFARACRTKRAVSYESVAVGENGEPNHTYVVRAFPVITEGRVTALVLVPTDITERVRLERSLIESEQAMRLAVGAAHMGLWRWDLRNSRITWDDRTREIFGVDEAPATFESYLALVHPDDQALVTRVVREASESGIYPSFEHRLAPRTGETPGPFERWVLAAGTVFKDATGATVAMLGGVLDVTEQKRLILQMQRTGRVEALGELTAGIAHNFNNLLGAILPNLEIALVEAPDALRASLSAALDASLQARDLVKSLMSLSLRRAATPGIPSDVTDVVSRLDAICKLTFPKEIEIQTVLGPQLGLVAMPASELEQVLLNLLFNARDAVMETAGGSRHIMLQVDRVGDDPSGRHIRFRVVDNGIGMSEAVRKQIFAPFFTTKPPHRGSGLGLANAMSRVQEAGGRLECQSAAGRGTTFTLSLPVGVPAVAAAVSPPGPQPAVPRGSETILLVDDEPLVRNVVARVLRSQRYEIVEASSAEGAREALKTHGPRINLVLLDQSMPAETGLEALPSLKKLSPAPIILFTGLATDLPEGVAALLEKPARPAELLRLVREVLEEHAVVGR